MTRQGFISEWVWYSTEKADVIQSEKDKHILSTMIIYRIGKLRSGKMKDVSLISYFLLILAKKHLLLSIEMLYIPQTKVGKEGKK